ncbi:hypothetical protein FA13DRAFT_1753815 [Coprinellus micaceus]|uniref:F-box domain-containing protein n=1 Tax=Coprinellus micaceus TaxID=71717 RepID=A0A4Y7TJ61_COPMI|nr:hypothetical protein FA13DRAFT_1753815 [Coprinellus micaceus]
MLDFHQEEFPEIDAGIFEDRRALARVCSTFRVLVTEVCVEYIVVHRGEELEHVARLLKRSKPNAAGKRLGEKTTRVDLKIIGPYNPKLIATLLTHTPNLLVFVNHNGRTTGVLGRLPSELLQALITHGKHIRRLEFDSINEAPSLHDIIDIAESCHSLESLSLRCIHSYPNDPDVIEKLPIVNFNALKTLLLNRISRPAGTARPPDYSTSWDPLPRLLQSEYQAIPPARTAAGMGFFHTHGRKFRMLKTTTWSVGSILPEVLEQCNNLDSLVLVQGSAGPPRFPSEVPNIRRICITPYAEETARVPPHIFTSALLEPLDELIAALDGASYGSLSEVRIRNIGAYDGLVEYGLWLDTWWRRFNIRGIRFVDKEGCSYENVVDPGEALLNTVRG